MMAEKTVKAHQRTLASGKTITVGEHDRINEESAAQSLTIPGRPPIAASRGKFAGGRSIPGVWAQPVPRKTPPKKEAPLKKDREAPVLSSTTEKVVRLSSLVHVGSYKRRNSAGELVDVRSYNRAGSDGSKETEKDPLSDSDFQVSQLKEKEKVVRGEGFFLLKGSRTKVELKTSSGELIGSISWRTGDSYDEEPGEVLWLHVEPAWRRKGVATKLWNRAQQIDSNVKHSTTQTDQGSAWAKTVG